MDNEPRKDSQPAGVRPRVSGESGFGSDPELDPTSPAFLDYLEKRLSLTPGSYRERFLCLDGAERIDGYGQKLLSKSYIVANDTEEAVGSDSESFLCWDGPPSSDPARKFSFPAPNCRKGRGPRFAREFWHQPQEKERKRSFPDHEGAADDGFLDCFSRDGGEKEKRATLRDVTAPVSAKPAGTVEAVVEGGGGDSGEDSGVGGGGADDENVGTRTPPRTSGDGDEDHPYVSIDDGLRRRRPRCRRRRPAGDGQCGFMPPFRL
jgi:hypothetical protein